MGILNTRQGEVCMVAPSLLDVHSYFFIELDSHWIIQRVMIFQSWPIPHKLCIVNYQGWSSLLQIVQTETLIFLLECHWILDHFDFTQDWILIELFCVQSFKGVTPRGRHTRPACN